MEAVLKSHGVHNYSIFLHPGTNQLFGYVEIEDEARWNAIAQTPQCKKWWAHMKDIMPSNPDNSPKGKWRSEKCFIMELNLKIPKSEIRNPKSRTNFQGLNAQMSEWSRRRFPSAPRGIRPKVGISGPWDFGFRISGFRI